MRGTYSGCITLIGIVLFHLVCATQSEDVFVETNGEFSFTSDGQPWMTGRIRSDGNFEECQSSAVKICRIVPNQFKIEIKEYSDFDSGAISCTDVVFEALAIDHVPEVCIDFGQSYWFGMAELFNQRWPLNDVSLPMQPFVTNDLVPSDIVLGNVIGRYWLNSAGVSLTVSEDTPLFSSFNESGSRKICLKAEYTKPFYNTKHVHLPRLTLKVCKSKDITTTHSAISQSLFALPSGLPDTRMFKSPVWSTWARYRVDINQSQVLEYANEILEHGFSNSQIEIDDMFSTFYGEFDFTATKFPYPRTMIKELKRKGFRVTVWVTPFANVDAPAFKEGARNSYWLQDERGQVPSLMPWWQGTGAVLDVSNGNAVDWYLKRLDMMKEEYDVDSFKFDAGEVTYLPASYTPLKPWDNPCEYTKLYSEAVSKMGSMIEVRCGYNSQHVPVFVRMADKESRWGYNNGLKTIIPTALTLGLLGYPFILPDMIGGNGYGDPSDVNFIRQVNLPDRELYIRWLQVTAYLPAMQFSFVPWQYDPEVVQLARMYVKIHEEEVYPILLRAGDESLHTGAPIIRPLWWIAPTDEFALTSDSQFLVGAELMVAPVLEAGARQRDIYIPAGKWEDQQRGVGVKGPRWLKNYEVQLSQVATFKKA